jgi:L-ascorbate metabolism protein UlaG (beta-lactamase superfamily)
MEVSYLGHSSFKIKTKAGTLVTDPYDPSVGMKMPSVSADLVTVSHDHHDHNYVNAITGTARRKEPFIIREAGEYEVEGISVFGYQTFHDDKDGSERGKNTIYVIQAEDLRLLHLGDLGHPLSDKLVDELDGIDVVFIPVGGVYTIDAKQAAELALKIEAPYVVPMHYKTETHDPKTFGELTTREKFLELYDRPVKEASSLSLTKAGLAPDATEVVFFS